MISNLAVGIGLRQPHYGEVFERRPALGFLEVHSENFFLDGGASMHALERARAAYPISLHGVGLSLGSADDALAQRHLAKLKRLVDRVEPALVSEHLSWSGLGGQHFNDLLPLPHTHEVLALLVQRVDRVQNLLKRRILVENVSAYVQYRDRDMSETALLDELARRSGCGILLDVNNLYVNAVNHGYDAMEAMQALPAAAIREIHLAGHSRGEDCLIDDHGSQVASDVWQLYASVRERVGDVPVLIEWDTNIPALQVLVAEARRADALRETACA